MKHATVKQVLDAAGKLPAAKARALVGALAAKLEIGKEAPLEAFQQALRADMKPLGDALMSAYRSGDLGAMTAALKKISKEMPEFAGQGRELETLITGQLATALLKP